MQGNVGCGSATMIDQAVAIARGNELGEGTESSDNGRPAGAVWRGRVHRQYHHARPQHALNLALLI